MTNNMIKKYNYQIYNSSTIMKREEKNMRLLTLHLHKTHNSVVEMETRRIILRAPTLELFYQTI